MPDEERLYVFSHMGFHVKYVSLIYVSTVNEYLQVCRISNDKILWSVDCYALKSIYIVYVC